MIRIRAFLLHLLISIVVFGLIFGILILFWYPTPYFVASGGLEGLKIVAIVDLVLGPILTLVIFKNKKSKRLLLMDLAVIVVIQIFALVMGVHTIYKQRPVANVFWLGNFLTVTADDITEQGVHIDDIKLLNSKKPVFIYIKESNPEPKYYVSQGREESQITISPFYRVDLYRSLNENFNDIEKYQLDMTLLVKQNENLHTQLSAFLADEKSKMEDFQYYKLISKNNKVIVIFDKNKRTKGYILMPLTFTF